MKFDLYKKWMLFNLALIVLLVIPILTQKVQIDDMWRRYALYVSVSVALHLTLIITDQSKVDTD